MNDIREVNIRYVKVGKEISAQEMDDAVAVILQSEKDTAEFFEEWAEDYALGSEPKITKADCAAAYAAAFLKAKELG